MAHPRSPRVAVVAALALCALALNGCGGGGASVAPHAADAPPARGGTATLSITVPGGAPALVPRATGRRPSFVSPGTQKVAVYINGASTPTATVNLPAPTGSPATYQISVNAPFGTDTFRVDLLDAQAVALATGTSAPTTVAASGPPATVDITTLGIPAFAVFNVPDASTRPPYTGPATIPLNLVMTDADGYAISGTYSQPIALALSPTSGGNSLSAATAASSSDAAALTLNYSGSSPAPIRVYVTLNGAAVIPQNDVGSVVIRPGALPTGNALVAYNTAPNVAAVNRILSAGYTSSIVATFTKNVTALASSPDGAESYIGFADGSIKRYDGASKSITATIASGGSNVYALTFTDDGGTAYALVQSGSSYGVVRFTFDAPNNAPALLPPAATGCAGIAAFYYSSGKATVSCTNATYRISTPFVGPPDAPVASAPGSGGAVIGANLAGIFYAANPTGSVNVFAGTTSVGTFAAPAGASPLALDPSERFLYVGATGTVATERIVADGSGPVTGTVAKSVVVPGTVTALADFPGSSSAAPDSTVWAADSNGTVIVIDVPTNTVKQTITLPGSPVGIGFVP